MVGIHTSIINLEIKNNIVLKRWMRVHTLCYPKDPGTQKYHRLHPLNLYEEDLNLTL